jgi:hypothetical protein
MSDRASDITDDVRAQAGSLQPHLVCHWTVDPASDRLSCAWAAPTVGRDAALARARLRPALAPAAKEIA